jgi:hypothetical protein
VGRSLDLSDAPHLLKRCVAECGTRDRYNPARSTSSKPTTSLPHAFRGGWVSKPPVHKMLLDHCLTKPPDTVGELRRADNCASRLASLRAQDHENASAERLAWEGRNRFANSIPPFGETYVDACVVFPMPRRELSHWQRDWDSLPGQALKFTVYPAYRQSG